MIRPVLFSPPSEWNVHYLARGLNTIQGIKRPQKYCSLLVFFKGFSERMTKGPLQKYGPWRPHFFRIFPHYRYSDRRNPDPLDFSLDQSN